MRVAIGLEEKRVVEADVRSMEIREEGYSISHNTRNNKRVLG